MTRRIVLALMGAICLLPTVSAGEYTAASYYFTPFRVEFGASEGLAESEARDLRVLLDTDGDRGVSASEVESYERAENRSFQPRPACFEAFGFLTIDGRAPVSLESSKVSLFDALGPVDTPDPLYMRRTLTVAFPIGPSPEGDVTLRPSLESQMADAYECTSGRDAPAVFRSTAARENVNVWAGPDLWFDTDTIRPKGVRPLFLNSFSYGDATYHSLSSSEKTVAQFYSSEVTFRVTTELRQGTWADWLAWTLGGMAGGGLLVGLGAALTEVGRFRLAMAVAAIPLFARKEGDEVLENDRRGRIYEFIRGHPGVSFADLRRAFGIGHGTMVHHLRMLEGQEFVKGVRDGFRARFFIRGPRIEVETYLSRTQQSILETVSLNPGIATRHLALMLGLPTENLYYHARKLESSGKLRIQKAAKAHQYYVGPPTVPGAPNATAKSPVVN